MKIYLLERSDTAPDVTSSMEGYVKHVIIATSANTARRAAQALNDDYINLGGMDWLNINHATAMILGTPSGVWAASSETRIVVSEGVFW